jgi:predicted nuclease of predicted toxin-antitoxin system
VRAAALELERAILSKDDDFQQLSESLGFPPKVLWVNLGNCSTRTVLEAILARQNDIRSFLAESETGVLILDP